MPSSKDVKTKTAIAVLRAFPGPQELLAAPKAKVMRVLQQASRNLGEDTYASLCEGARQTIALAGGLAALKAEVALLLDEDFHGDQIKKIEAAMKSTMTSLPEAQALMTIHLDPGCHAPALVHLKSLTREQPVGMSIFNQEARLPHGWVFLLGRRRVKLQHHTPAIHLPVRLLREFARGRVPDSGERLVASPTLTRSPVHSARMRFQSHRTTSPIAFRKLRCMRYIRAIRVLPCHWLIRTLD